MTKQANRGSATVNCVFALCYALKSVSVALHSCCSSCPVSTEIHQYQYHHHHHHHHMSNSNICPCHLRTNKLSSIKYVWDLYSTSKTFIPRLKEQLPCRPMLITAGYIERVHSLPTSLSGAFICLQLADE